MSGFNLHKPYTMSEDEVREAAEGLAKQLEQQHRVHASWEGDSVVIIKGSGVDGRLTFHDGNIDVSVKLGLLASAFRGILRKEIQRYLDEHIS